MANVDIEKREAQSPSETERTRSRRVYIPSVDIYESKDAVMLVADMPGVDEKSVDITLEKSVLTISGAVDPDAFEGFHLAYSEYGTGDYQRSFTVSDEIDRDKIVATVRNGVLRLTLPKAEKVKAKKIAVRAE
jgi:HSP20 family molecular chaperone IbpA